MHFDSWLLYATFISSTSAFYPFHFPKDLPNSVEPVSSGKKNVASRANEGHEGEARNPTTLSIKRRAPPANSHPYFWSAVEMKAMARRFTWHQDHDRRDQLLNLRSRSIVRRDNSFPVVTAAQPKQTDSVAIDQDGTDFSYFSQLKFGASGKTIYMLIDTGAASTWIMGSDCTSKPCASHSTFGIQDSSTLKVADSKFNISYGTGTVSGLIANDSVSLAGFSIPLSFGLATTVSDEFLAYPMDGILGLGRPALKVMESQTAMEIIQNSKLLETNIIGINLQRNSDGDTDGEMSFGLSDTAKYGGDLSYTSTTPDNALWEIPVDDIVVGGVACNFSGKTGIIDTGTSFILLPPMDAQRFHALIPQSQQAGDVFNVPCSSATSVRISISGVSYNITSKDYVGNPTKGAGLCSSNVIGRQAFGPNQWLLGDVFLKNVYTVFDFDRNRIGFGVKGNHSSEVSSSPSIAASPTVSPVLKTKPTTTPILSESILIPETAQSTAPSVAQSTAPSMKDATTTPTSGIPSSSPSAITSASKPSSGTPILHLADMISWQGLFALWIILLWH